MVIIAPAILAIAFTIASAYVDAEHLNDKDYIENHASRAIMRGIFFLAIGLTGWMNMVAAALMFASLFDHLLNILTDKTFFYLGTTAKWDKFWRKRKVIYIIANVLMITGSIYLFTKAI